MKAVQQALFGILMVVMGLVFLAVVHPTDGQETLAIVLVVAGIGSVVGGKELTILDRLLGAVPTVAGVGSPSPSPATPSDASSTPSSTTISTGQSGTP